MLILFCSRLEPNSSQWGQEVIWPRVGQTIFLSGPLGTHAAGTSGTRKKTMCRGGQDPSNNNKATHKVSMSQGQNFYNETKLPVNLFLFLLERALRALPSSSGGAAWPGGTRGQPRGSTPGVRGWFQGDLSKKKFLWRTYGRTENGRTDGSVEIVI